MRFEFPEGKWYKIWFKYTLHDGKREVLALIDEEDAPGTTFAAGAALCAKSDQFRKETGRKVALTKAMPQLNNGRNNVTDSNSKIYNVCGGDWDRIKQFRTAAWQCYHKRAEQPKGVASGH